MCIFLHMAWYVMVCAGILLILLRYPCLLWAHSSVHWGLAEAPRRSHVAASRSHRGATAWNGIASQQAIALTAKECYGQLKEVWKSNLRQFWTDEKQRWEESTKKARRGSQRREENRRESQRKSEEEDAGARRGRKVAKHCLFPMICGSGGSKRRLAKAAGAEPFGQMRDEKLRAIVTGSSCEVYRPHWADPHCTLCFLYRLWILSSVLSLQFVVQLSSCLRVIILM